MHNMYSKMQEYVEKQQQGYQVGRTKVEGTGL